MHEVFLRPNRFKQVLLADPTFVEHGNHPNGSIAAWSMSGIHIFGGPKFGQVETPFPCTLNPIGSEPINISERGFGPSALYDYVKAVTASDSGELHLPLRPFFHTEPDSTTTHMYMEHRVIPWKDGAMQPSYSDIKVASSTDLQEWTEPQAVLAESPDYHLPSCPSVFRDKSGALRMNFAHGVFTPGNSTLDEPSEIATAISTENNPLARFIPQGPIIVFSEEGEKIEHVGTVRVRNDKTTGEEIITCNPFSPNPNGDGSFVSSLCRAKRIGDAAYQVTKTLSATNLKAENAYVGDVMNQNGGAAFIYNVRERIHPLLDKGISGNGVLGIFVLLVKNILTGNELIYKTLLEV